MKKLLFKTLLLATSICVIAPRNTVSSAKAEEKYVTTKINYYGFGDDNYPTNEFYYDRSTTTGRYASYACEMKAGESISFNLRNDFAGLKIHGVSLGFRGSYYSIFEAYAVMQTQNRVIWSLGTPENGADYYYDFGYTGWNYETQYCPIDLDTNVDTLMGADENLTITIGCTWVDPHSTMGTYADNAFSVVGLKITYIDNGSTVVKKSKTNSSLAMNYYRGSDTTGTHYYERIDDVDDLKDGDKITIMSAESALGNETSFHYMEMMPEDNGIPAEIQSRKAGVDFIVGDKYLETKAFDSNLLTVERSGNDFAFKTKSYGYMTGDAMDGSIPLNLNGRKYDLPYEEDRIDWLWNINISNSLATIVNRNTKIQKRYVGYDSFNDKFVCKESLYTNSDLSKDERVVIYRVGSYSVSSVGLRFGLTIKKTTYDAVINAGGVFGVCVNKTGFATLNESSTQVIIDPVRVDENGVESASGDYYQFALVLQNIPQTAWKQTIYANAFVKVNGVYSFTEEGASFSIYDIAKRYVQQYGEDPAVIEHFLALKTIIDICESEAE